MATETSHEMTDTGDAERTEESVFADAVRVVLEPLASLRITVTLLALGMFLVLAASSAAIGSGVLAIWAIFAAMLIGGLMRGAYNASRDMLVRNAAPGGRVGSAFAFVTLGYTVGQGGTPVIYGWLMDQGMGEGVFYVSAGFAIAAIATLVGQGGKARKQPA